MGADKVSSASSSCPRLVMVEPLPSKPLSAQHSCFPNAGGRNVHGRSLPAQPPLLLTIVRRSLATTTTTAAETTSTGAATASHSNPAPSSSRAVVSWNTLRSLLWHSPRWAVGLAILTPAVALLQGSFLLTEYRRNHGNAPFPISPSQGVVMVRPTQQDKAQQQAKRYLRLDQDSSSAPSSLPPLRLLVIGDSLAVGVGVTRQVTPVLPESIARRLSQQLGGRPVYWTCLGRPGASTADTVRQIQQQNNMHPNHHHDKTRRHVMSDDDDHDYFLDFVSDDEDSDDSGSGVGSSNRRMNGRSSSSKPKTRFQQMRHRYKKWLRERRQRRRRLREQEQQRSSAQEQPPSNQSDDKKQSSRSFTSHTVHHVVAWWALLQEDIKTLPTVWQKPSTGEEEMFDDYFDYDDDDEDDEGTQDSNIDAPFLLWQQWNRRLHRRRSLRDRTAVGNYDIAVVITGTNDLKEVILPFLMVGPNKSWAKLKEEEEANAAATPSNKDSSASTTPNDTSTSAGDKGKNKTIKENLESVLVALQSQMRLVLSQGDQRDELSGSDPSANETSTTVPSSKNLTTRNSQRRPPLVVFPGLPASLVPMFHKPPMSWFVFRVFRLLDDYKRNISSQFPGQVLFIDPPEPADQILYGEKIKASALEDDNKDSSKDGRKGEDDDENNQLEVRLTNVRQRVLERAETVMKEYWEKWADRISAENRARKQKRKTDAEDRHSQAGIQDQSYLGYHGDDEDENLNEKSERPLEIRRFVSFDNLHPSDDGYKFWGEYIANAIIKEWYEQDQSDHE